MLHSRQRSLVLAQIAQFEVHTTQLPGGPASRTKPSLHVEQVLAPAPEQAEQELGQASQLEVAEFANFPAGQVWMQVPSSCR